MSQPKKLPRKARRRKGLQANYGGATLEQVAKAVLSPRPKQPQPASPDPQTAGNPSI